MLCARAAYAYFTEDIVFALSVAASVPSSVPYQIDFFYFARILNGFRFNSREVVSYHKQIKWLSFGEIGIWNKGAGVLERKFESTSIGFAPMSNRCWHLTNKFTNFTAQMTVDAIADSFTLHIYKFHMNRFKILQQFFFHSLKLYNFFQQRTQTPSLCPFFFAHSQRVSDKCSGRGIIWPCANFSSLLLLLSFIFCSLYQWQWIPLSVLTCL